MIARAPSLRELRASRPANVTILPNAAPRQVAQRPNRAMRTAAQKLRERHAERFGYKHPQVCEQIETAETLLAIERTPAMHIVVAILSCMDREDAEKIVRKLSINTGSDSARQAHAIAKSKLLTTGEVAALMSAIDVIKRERAI